MILTVLRLVSERPPEDDAVAPGRPATDTERALAEVLPHVRLLLYRLLGPRADLDDVVQDALVAIARGLPRFEGRASLRTFAERIAVRVAYRYFGRRAREASLELVAPPPDVIDPESRAMSREALRRLHLCLERLPAKRRLAFVLCDVEGRPPEEAAALVGARPSAMRARLMHARREVARRLRKDPYASAWLGEDEP